MDYCGRNPVILNVTLTNANTWYKVADAIAGVRRWMIKTNESTANAFDIAFKSAPVTFMSNSSVGFSLDNCDLPDTYCRSSTAGTVIEILIFG